MTDDVLAAMRANEPYKDIATRFGLSINQVWKLAKKHGLQRRRGRKVGEHTTITTVEDARPRCLLCDIILDEIDEGVALVTQDGKEHRVCQTCIAMYTLWLNVQSWEREPITMGAYDE